MGQAHLCAVLGCQEETGGGYSHTRGLSVISTVAFSFLPFFFFKLLFKVYLLVF